MLYIQHKDGVPFGNPVIHDNLLWVLPKGLIQPDRVPRVEEIWDHGFTLYLPEQRPDPTGPYQVIEEVAPVLDEMRRAHQTWVERPMNDDERAHATAMRIHQIQRIRRNRFDSCAWFIERHQEEKALGLETSITEDAYLSLLQYRQALRDLDYSDPLNVQWPAQPSLVAPQNTGA